MRKKLSIRTVTLIAVMAVLILTAALTVLVLFGYPYFMGGRIVEGRHAPLVISLLFASSAFGALVSIPITRFFVVPIRDLAKATEEVKKGNFAVRVEGEQTSDELNSLVTGFNEMVEELENTELLRTDFISNFSHEFKTPIASVRGFAKELLADGDLSEEQRREYLEIIVEESERLSGMAAKVLLLTDLEHTRALGKAERFSLDEQIRHSILLLEKQWSKKDIELNIELEPTTYVSDPDILSQMWLNLLSNAIKFSPTGGRVTVSCKNGEGGVYVSVEDEGEGIPPDKIERIFDRFYQADTSHRSEGNGLGLALCRRISELCGGSISVKSELAKGTVFTVVLPESH